MDESEWLTERFEQHRTHLRAVAYRMLGSISDTDDALQEAWLRVRDQDPATVENMRGWLTTVVGRVCLNMLRSRTARREELSVHVPDPVVGFEEGDVEHEALHRSEAAAQQLASRARRRLRCSPEPDRDIARQRRVVEAALSEGGASSQ